MTPKINKPLAGYMRVSHTGDHESRGPPTRGHRTRRAAEGIAVEFFEPEIDVSGSKKGRQVLDQIVASVRAGYLAGIVVAKLDRFSQFASTDRCCCCETIENADAVVLCASEQLDVSSGHACVARASARAL
jgi:DNA invertase Pin-like site-specific DNA recombinase